jgi:hypothetical protein
MSRIKGVYLRLARIGKSSSLKIFPESSFTHLRYARCL